MLRRIFSGGLRRQILAWSVLPTLVILAGVAYFSFWAYSQVTELLVMDRNRELTRLLAGQMALELAEYADRLTSLAQARATGDDQAPAPWLSHLELHAPDLLDFDSGVIVLNQEGVVVAADPRRLDLLARDFSNRSYVRRIHAQPAPVLLSDIERDGWEGGPVVAVAVPLMENEAQASEIVVGMFAVEPMAASVFYRDLLRLDLRAESRIFLVDSNGLAIYHHDPEQIGSDLSGQVAVQAVRAGRVGAWRGPDAQGQAIIASFAPIPNTLSGLVEEESWAELGRIAMGYGQVLLLILFLGLIVPAAVVGLAIRVITRPIRALTASAHGMSLGDLSQRVDIKPGNELGELAAAFNHMAQQLQSIHANLEEQVGARTRELSAMNSIAQVVSRSLDLEEVLSSALENVLALVGMTTGSAFEIEPGSSILELIANIGQPEDLSPGGSNVPIEELGSKDSLAKGAQVWLRDEFPVTEWWSDLAHEGWEQVILAPLVRKGEMIGLLSLRSRASRPIAESELALLDSIGSQIGVAVENARLYREAGALAAMAERNRLAQDLHDSVTQTIFTLNLLAGVIPMIYEEDPEEARQHLDDVGQLARSALNEMRALLLELRPDTLALMPLEELLVRLGESTATSVPMPVHISVESGLEMPIAVRVALYRIAQEAINNVVKHSAADQAWLGLWKRTSNGVQGVELQIRDDGQGFDQSSGEAGRLGLAIMRERANDIHARLILESAPGGGTTVRVIWWASQNAEQQ